MANFHHMLKRKGQAEHVASGYINIPLWREGDERRVNIGDERVYVRVVNRIDRERTIYTEEIDPLCLVEWASERRVTYALPSAQGPQAAELVRSNHPEPADAGLAL
ncbi:MAG TPA: hypothetical protein VMA53_09665 [Stellaceae bacterium]|nr:hypothetical protein [Stellaceae bacterium]